MTDFKGHIDAIIHAFDKYPAGDINTRLIVRKVLAGVREEAWQAGYSEGLHDQREAYRSDRERAERKAAGPGTTATAAECKAPLQHLAVAAPPGTPRKETGDGA